MSHNNELNQIQINNTIEQSQTSQNNNIKQKELPLECDIKLNNNKTTRGEHIFICKVCSKEFNYKKVFERHYSKHNPSNKTTFDCVLCKKIFFSEGFLRRHLKMHARKDRHVLIDKDISLNDIDKVNYPYSYLLSYFSYNKNKCLICNKSNINNTERLNSHLKHHI